MMQINNICKSKFKNQNGKEVNVMKNTNICKEENLFDADLWSENLCPFCGTDQVKIELDPEDCDETWIAHADCEACGEKWTNVWDDTEGAYAIHRYGRDWLPW